MTFSSIVSQAFRSLGDALTVPLLLLVLLILFIAVTRAASSLRYLFRQRGRRPLVIQVEYGKAEQEDGEDHGALDARLLDYLAADGHGSYVMAPGAGGPAAPRLPAEAAEPSAALFRLAFAREPAYRVDVTWPRRLIAGTGLRATVRITRTPTDRLVASRSFTEDTLDDLIETAGCFCITFLRSQPRILRQTPRWERWSLDVNGYRAYRRGLDHQRRAEIASSAREYKTALDYFHQAARLEPANMLVQLHRAALLERDNEHEAAVAIYKKSRALWPEHIETAYRLGNAHKSIEGHVTLAELHRPLRDIRRQLSPSVLLMAWLRSCAPRRWNPGERNYWGSWLSIRRRGGISKRSLYLNAVAISELLADLSTLLNELPESLRDRGEGQVPASRCPGSGPQKSEQQKAGELKLQATELIGRLAGEILHRGTGPACVRLLRPDWLSTPDSRSGDQPPPGSMDDLSYIPTLGRARRGRRNSGWLALFNAACFLSLAIGLPPECVPDEFTDKPRWQDSCARAAIRELGVLFRHPQHALDPDWLRTDPDLARLRTSPVGREWAGFVGLLDPPS
ncbi:MAG TPA: tetratricopeptide repeat protein [Streptosporangiaceae bacterium]|jgi:tetratricopeptide (TPR) repeat protein|nr:tetratricopeptide repeat protein [Streptosporangiaceae bacterium]